eukprot:TRINITY_DN19157_c0_g1_i2.p1 TRINITY_DN19157_c0_g1~~TRINITY_DN19157_c0_g1_i2.p1  ORF type:complete len:628 (-),score=90.81 TRINITY_DN19157_c0_g1_i2:1067-2950(-)
METVLGAPPMEFLKFWTLPQKFRLLAFRRRMVEDQVAHNLKVSGGTAMRKTMTWVSFLCLGLGDIIATGAFSFLPYVYATVTGPAVLLSILLASVTAATSAMIYSEFSVQYPVVGGAFVYVLNTFGEYPAVLCAAGIIMEYAFGLGAVARNFSLYFSELIDRPDNIFQVSVSFQSDKIDYVALILIIILAIICCFSTKLFDESNRVMQVIHVFLVLFVTIVGFCYSNTDNLTPFFPPVCETSCPAGGGIPDQSCLPNSAGTHPAGRVVTGASKLFFIFLGYDIVAISAEEASSDLAVPVGMLLAVASVTVIYLLLALSLIMLLPFPALACKTSNEIISGFAYAFTLHGAVWMKYFVAAGACVGIITASGTSIYGLSRGFQVFARESMIPPFFGYLHPKTATPILAIIVATVAGGGMAFFSAFDTLANMTSIGALSFFWFVAIASIYTRYAPELELPDRHGYRHEHIPYRPEIQIFSQLSVRLRRGVVLLYIALLTAWAVVFAVLWNNSQTSFGLIICLCGWFATTLLMQVTMPIQFVPEKFALPWYSMPWIPSASIWCTIMLCGGFGASVEDYWRLLGGFGIATAIYLLFGLHASFWRFYGGDEVEEEEYEGDEEKAMEGDARSPSA